MKDICADCRFLRQARSRTASSEVSLPRTPAMMALLNKRRRDAKSRQAEERAIVDGASSAPLEGAPQFFDWCEAKSDRNSGAFFFRNWQAAGICEDHKCVTPSPECPGCFSGDGDCVMGHNATVQSDQKYPAFQGMPAAGHSALSESTTRAAMEGVQLGVSVDLTTLTTGTGTTQELDYRFVDSTSEAPWITGHGFTQTYMIFGGPGAGKTTLFKYLLGNVLNHPSEPGCLLLDPKGAELAFWMRRVVEARQSHKDVLEISPNSVVACNIFGSKLRPRELGRLLAEVVLAQAGDIDDAWQVLVTDLLESSVVILASLGKAVTPALLLSEILYEVATPFRGKTARIYPIRASADVLYHSPGATEEQRNACRRVAEYIQTDEKNRRFVRALLEKTLGDLREEAWLGLSQPDGVDIYDEVISGHGVVSVSVGYANPAFQKSLLTLVKAIFQQYALAQMPTREATDPFFVLACDEYAQIVTEGSSGLVSDAGFFSQSRQAGCMSLLALQSMATARSRFPSAMRDRWEGILGNVAGRIFMKLNDPDTAEFASGLLGKRQVRIRSASTAVSSQGSSTTDSYTMVERANVPEWVFTSRLPTFYGLAQGSFDGLTSVAAFVRIEPDEATWGLKESARQ